MPSLCTGVTFKPLGNREGKAMLNEVRRTARAWNLRSAVHRAYILTAVHRSFLLLYQSSGKEDV